MKSIQKNSEYKSICKDKFIKYVQYDTQSDEDSKSIPSTEKQKILLKELMSELKQLGVESSMDKNGHVYATIKSNSKKRVPIIGFLAHVDTSPAVSGKNVKPMVHKFTGQKIILPKDNQIVEIVDKIRLKELMGHDIITSDGSTLLGADNKAGIASIMDAVNYFVKNPQVKHGDIAIAFTIDEEIGSGINSFDVKKFGAKYAYTMDGATVGEIEGESFNASNILITIYGKNVHPGYAKNIMINSLKIASEFVNKLPKDKLCPEKTEGRQGYIHASEIKGNEEKTIIKMIVRDFEEEKLQIYENDIKKMLDECIKNYPSTKYDFEISRPYKNMKSIIDKSPQVMDYAIEAMKRIGIKPKLNFIRGGTDGSKLSFRGIPTPNIFCGENNLHSKNEFVSVQEMELAVKTIIEICKIWEEKS